MREIRFRGKRIDTGEWVYGYYFWNDAENKPYIIEDTIDEYEVEFNTIGQYTGLKDKNGKEIYEGDIVHCWGGEYCQGYWEHDSKVTINNMINDCFMMGEHEFIEVNRQHTR